MKPEFDYLSYCLNCIHETICHSVTDGLVYVPGFTCNDRELCAPAGTIERAYFIKENGEIILIPLDRLILNRKADVNPCMICKTILRKGCERCELCKLYIEWRARNK